MSEDGTLESSAPPTREQRSLHGLTRTLIANMVTGVTTGFTRRLEINGVGYRAFGPATWCSRSGYSHPVGFPAPEGITLTVEGPTASW